MGDLVDVRLDVVDFCEVRRKSTVSLERLVGCTLLVKRIVRMGESYAYVVVEVAGEGGVEREVKVRGRVLLKQLRMMVPFLEQGKMVRATLMRKTSRNGVEYYVFV